MVRNGSAQPGASTAPVTSTRTRFQTGVVKYGWNTDSQVARIGGISGLAAMAAEHRFGCFPVVESSRSPLARVDVATATDPAGYHVRHEQFDRGAHQELSLRSRAAVRRTPQSWLHAVPRSLGHTEIAPLRPTGRDDRVEVLHWSHWAEKWKSGGPLGRTVSALDDALQFIESEDILGCGLSQESLSEMRKVKLRPQRPEDHIASPNMRFFFRCPHCTRIGCRACRAGCFAFSVVVR